MFKSGGERVEVIVVGGGVSGLTCGIRLLEKQFPVTIFTEKLPPDTTSDVPAAVWYPYKIYPAERVGEWARIALDEYYRLMTVPESGVSPLEFIELFEEPVTEDPEWKDSVRLFRRASSEELPPGYQDGYFIEVPLIETPIYMPYLKTRFEQLGGQIKLGKISRLDDLYGDNRLIVNCAGLGARELVDDERLYPIRGQIIRVKASGLLRGLVCESGTRGLAYIVPRSRDCILGGTDEKDNWELEVNEATSDDILRKCMELDPALKTAEKISDVVGLRPGRDEVRLDVEPISEKCAVIHNYGHGGAGFTVSWGCADEVAALADEFRDTLAT